MPNRHDKKQNQAFTGKLVAGGCKDHTHAAAVPQNRVQPRQGSGAAKKERNSNREIDGRRVAIHGNGS